MKKSGLNEIRRFVREEFDPRDVDGVNLLVDIAHKNGVSDAALMAEPENFAARLAEGIGYKRSLDDFMSYVAEVSKRLAEARKLTDEEPAEEKRFGVFSPDGTTLDANGREWDNVQLIDIIKAKSFEDALAEARDNLRRGAYEGFEYLHLREIGKGREFGEGVEE